MNPQSKLCTMTRLELVKTTFVVSTPVELWLPTIHKFWLAIAMLQLQAYGFMLYKAKTGEGRNTDYKKTISLWTTLPPPLPFLHSLDPPTQSLPPFASPTFTTSAGPGLSKKEPAAIASWVVSIGFPTLSCCTVTACAISVAFSCVSASMQNHCERYSSISTSTRWHH